ncbi:SF1B family DNA helicase RecD2 [Desulfonatronum thioautotrophicum]|uniref:SF1B family DNA helicase RecD2 n=1 Tax=Desulfonatronum thioautotrophicum TaxID=617001 RepID=UPI0005EB96CB|nr:ATP-dependent RecD-like DNA helicase [Desulfonatronum thioautotrophicum]
MFHIHAQIEKIIHSNDETGYYVVKVHAKDHKEFFTAVGNLYSVYPGEVFKLWGDWEAHPKYGPQFKVQNCEAALPTTTNAIRKYLGSGLIKGIGPVMAGRIVRLFGDQSLDIIDHKTELLTKVQGIGKKRIGLIHQAWEDQKAIRRLMKFLQDHGVRSTYAPKIYKQYGKDAISIIQDNPYQLVQDIWGIGFKTADNVAQVLGISNASPLRIDAGIVHVLHELAGEGHVYYPEDPLLAKAGKILKVDREILKPGIARLVERKHIVLDHPPKKGQGQKECQPDKGKSVYLTKYHHCEAGTAKRLSALINAPRNVRQVDMDKALVWVQDMMNLSLATKQQEAVRCALFAKVMVITGGPGTGKTTTIQSILRIFSHLTQRIVLTAPTGRAAKRMSEATNHQAKTIHLLLEFSPSSGSFKRNAEKPLSADLLMVDEASMIDQVLMYHLVQAVPLGCAVVLVGDIYQLPSVNAGNVLHDIIASEVVPVITLNDIFRQAQNSSIISNAHRINAGHMPELQPRQDPDDFYFIHQEEPEKTLEVIINMVTERIPARFGLDPINDIQVLSPMHGGLVGADNLNIVLQEVLNPSGPCIERGARKFRVNDKVMQIRNNYDKLVFNGDIGRVTKVDQEMRELVVHFDDRDVLYEFMELDELDLGYAATIHKSQGSEYPAVIMPVLTTHYIMLQRNLIYTGITRGKRLVVLVGTKKELAKAINKNNIGKRYSNLYGRLRGFFDNK